MSYIELLLIDYPTGSNFSHYAIISFLNNENMNVRYFVWQGHITAKLSIIWRCLIAFHLIVLRGYIWTKQKYQLGLLFLGKILVNNTGRIEETSHTISIKDHNIKNKLRKVFRKSCLITVIASLRMKELKATRSPYMVTLVWAWIPIYYSGLEKKKYTFIT